jgi:antitoxin (DNA-binding transcriptional repressor) of toxin-antitoxin stability system
MTRINIQEASQRLPSLVAEARDGEEVILTEGDVPVARLVAVGPSIHPQDESGARPKFGSGRGLIQYMAPDFDAPLDDFSEAFGQGNRIPRQSM